MPPSITLHDLAWSTPDNHLLFSGLDLSFGGGRTGLIGRNGTGKSTLLKLITGTLTPAAGSITTSGSIGMLRQEVQVDAGTTVAAVLGVAESLGRLDRIERGEGTDTDLAEADWLLPQRIEEALAEIGLGGLDPSRLVATLSGGQRTRIAAERVRSVSDVRAADRSLVGFSDGMAEHERRLKRFMYARLYHHPLQIAVAEQAGRIVAGLAGGTEVPESRVGTLPGDLLRLGLDGTMTAAPSPAPPPAPRPRWPPASTGRRSAAPSRSTAASTPATPTAP